jgi:hypothetical protein
VYYELLFIYIESVQASVLVFPTGADETTFDSWSYERFSGSQKMRTDKLFAVWFAEEYGPEGI